MPRVTKQSQIMVLEDNISRLKATIDYCNERIKIAIARDENQTNKIQELELYIQQLEANVQGLIYGLSLAAYNGRSWRVEYKKLKAKTSDTVGIAT